MGQVYRATDTQLGRDVALKILPDAFAADPDRLARFQREAQVLASLNHPNIATIHGFENEGPTRFLVMELVHGRSLRERMESDRLAGRDLLDLAVQIARVLEAAHASDIVHGDVKPDNIMVQASESGVELVKLLDFGVARRVAEAEGATLAGVVTRTVEEHPRLAGTLDYMAPEQLKGASADPRSDLFSLGVMVCEMAAGRRPFEGRDAAAVIAHIVSEPVPTIATVLEVK